MEPVRSEDAVHLVYDRLRGRSGVRVLRDRTANDQVVRAKAHGLARRGVSEVIIVGGANWPDARAHEQRLQKPCAARADLRSGDDQPVRAPLKQRRPALENLRRRTGFRHARQKRDHQHAGVRIPAPGCAGSLQRLYGETVRLRMDQGDELHVQSTTVPDEAPDRVSDITTQLQVEEDAPTATAALLYLLDEVEDVPGQEELQGSFTAVSGLGREGPALCQTGRFLLVLSAAERRGGLSPTPPEPKALPGWMPAPPRWGSPGRGGHLAALDFKAEVPAWGQSYGQRTAVELVRGACRSVRSSDVGEARPAVPTDARSLVERHGRNAGRSRSRHRVLSTSSSTAGRERSPTAGSRNLTFDPSTAAGPPMTRHRTAVRFCAILAALASAKGCGDGDSPTGMPDVPRPTTLAVSPTTAELTAFGATVQLAAEVRDQNAEVVAGGTVAWVSSSPAVATVDDSGLVTAAGNGVATITASAGTASGSAEITVTQAIDAVTVSPMEGTIGSGETLRLSAEAFDENGHTVTEVEFSWESSDTSVATVDMSGLVTGADVGVATITARAGGGQGTAEVTVTDLVAQDRAALVAFYRAAGGQYWGDDGFWLTDAPMGDWHGVETDAAGRIVSLRLDNNLLWGLIPPELGELGRLEYLSLGDNELTGPIPAELGNLASLRHLNLSENYLRETIPAELGNLARLEYLNLGENDLTGPLPAELGNLAGLEYLDLGHNVVTGPLPVELGNLARLDSLSLAGNDLTGPLPAWLGNLARLKYLSLSDNELTGPIPAELRGLASLEHLYLRSNELTGPVPAWLGSLASLEGLSLSHNEFSGPIPAELGNLANLWRLYLANNDLVGTIPAELGNLASLESLILRDNHLTGPIPRELGNLASLEYLDLFLNHLTGPIPRELGNLASLEDLILRNNELTGPLPAELGNLTSLQWLLIDHNPGLTGPLPASVTALGNLVRLEATATRLCAPQDPAFLAWLAALRVAEIAPCVVGTE